MNDGDIESLYRYLYGKEQFIQEQKLCKRCKRAIKAQFTYCYRCNNYIQVKRKIQEQSA